MSEHWARWVHTFGQARRLALVAFVLALPTLGFGLQSDDYAFEQLVRIDRLQAFAFFPNQTSLAQPRAYAVPDWWASDTFSLHLLRPLTSLTHALDFSLWPDAAWLMHLENAVIYALIVWLAAFAYRQVLARTFEAQLAAIFYAFGVWFPQAVGWIATRCASTQPGPEPVWRACCRI